MPSLQTVRSQEDTRHMQELQMSLSNLFPERPRWKYMWQLGTVSDLTVEEIAEKLEKAEKETQFLMKETALFEKYLRDQHISSASGSGDESSSGFGSHIRSQPSSPLALAARVLARSKPNRLTNKQKIIVARHCVQLYKDELKSMKDTTREFIEENLALVENYHRTLVDIQLERQEMEMEFGNLIKADGKIPFLHKWQKYVTSRRIKCNSLNCTTKIRNASLVRNINKKIMIKNYRNEVDPVEFYSKWLEKNTLKEEIKNIMKQKTRLRKALVPIERYTYERKQELEKNANQREDFRKRILREKHSLSYLVNKQRQQEEAKDEEKALNKQLHYVSEAYKSFSSVCRFFRWPKRRNSALSRNSAFYKRNGDRNSCHASDSLQGRSHEQNASLLMVSTVYEWSLFDLPNK